MKCGVETEVLDEEEVEESFGEGFADRKIGTVKAFLYAPADDQLIKEAEDEIPGLLDDDVYLADSHALLQLDDITELQVSEEGTSQ